MPADRIHLSVPHLSGEEWAYVQDALASNWIAPLGPHVEALQHEFASLSGARRALALSSGTAALHLALIECGVGAGDDVLVSTLTFAASVNPIRYQGAVPVFIDSERASWNMDPALLADALQERRRRGRLPKAVIVVHLYGQSADLDPIVRLCDEYGVPLIEDAAEALGATYRGKVPGTVGRAGVFSFNGNKIITTAGGGMLTSDDDALIDHAFKLATQARDPAPHYQHSEIGFNYRMSNILAAIGRAQLRVLPERVAARQRVFAYYRDALGDLPGISMSPDAGWGVHTRWLSVIEVDPEEFGASRDDIRLALEAGNIESRPVWKPMHLQPVFSAHECIGGGVAERIFANGLCLPSSSSLTESNLSRVVDAVRKVHAGAARHPK